MEAVFVVCVCLFLIVLHIWEHILSRKMLKCSQDVHRIAKEMSDTNQGLIDTNGELIAMNTRLMGYNRQLISMLGYEGSEE